MTPDEIAHLDFLLNSFDVTARAKYQRGAKEHKGDLLGMTPLELLVEIRDEAIDTFIYTQTAIIKYYKLEALRSKKRGRK